MSSILILLIAAGNWEFVFVFFSNTEPVPFGVDGVLQEGSLTAPPQPLCVCRDTCTLAFAALAGWHGLHYHRGGRPGEAQTSGAGWVPCDVYDCDYEKGGLSSQNAVSRTAWTCLLEYRS